MIIVLPGILNPVIFPDRKNPKIHPFCFVLIRLKIIFSPCKSLVFDRAVEKETSYIYYISMYGPEFEPWVDCVTIPGVKQLLLNKDYVFEQLSY